MLKLEQVLKEVDELYHPMIKELNLMDFYKCIAQFSGLNIQKVNDEVMLNYIKTWAKNKFKYYEFLGCTLKKDMPFEYEKTRDHIQEEIEPIKKDFPLYFPWLEMFHCQKQNLIDTRELGYRELRQLEKYFPQLNIAGLKITHFFKSYLNAPEALINRVASIFECDRINSTLTISIDPVDMMLASENPYDWQSCYRLELDNDESHADGCLAAVLDTSSLITYIWDRHGKYDLYSKYQFKDIRYKKMRAWIAIHPEWKAIHFNDIYPSKGYDFEPVYRQKIEGLVAQYINHKDLWKRADIDVRRYYPYGYSEYNGYHVWALSDEQGIYKWDVFDEKIDSPDGDGTLPGSYGGNEEYDYNGEGFVSSNFGEKGYWCEEADEYCQYDHWDCYECNEVECYYWRRNHLQCPDQARLECPNVEEMRDEQGGYISDIDDGDGYVDVCSHNCYMCEYYREHYPDDYAEWVEEKKKEDEERQQEEEEHKEETQLTTHLDSSNDSAAAIQYATLSSSLNSYPTLVWNTENISTLATTNSISYENVPDTIQRAIDAAVAEMVDKSIHDNGLTSLTDWAENLDREQFRRQVMGRLE